MQPRQALYEIKSRNLAQVRLLGSQAGKRGVAVRRAKVCRSHMQHACHGTAGVCAHLQWGPVLWGDLAMSACMAQLDGGSEHRIGRRPSDTMGRSGLFTTSLPGCTPCTQHHRGFGTRLFKACQPAPLYTLLRIVSLRRQRLRICIESLGHRGAGGLVC